MQGRDEAAPLAFVVSRLCEEFPAYTPLTAIADLEDGPVGWLTEVIEARHMAKAFAEVERKRQPQEPEPEGEYVDWYYQFKAEDFAAKRAAPASPESPE